MSINFKVLRNSTLVLLSAFFLSCENLSDIALNLKDSNGNSTFFTDTTLVEAGTILLDSALTSNEAAALIGIAEDPVFGKLAATAFIQPTLYTDPSFGTEVAFPAAKTAIVDSIYLRLVNKDLIVFGDTLAPVKFSIHRLKSGIAAGKNYNYDDSLPYDEIPLVSAEVNIRSFSSAKRDTIKVFKIALPTSIGTELIALAETDAAKTKSNFETAFRGFAIVAESSSKAIHVLNMGTGTSASSLSLYYHKTGETASSEYPFEFSANRFNHLIAERNGTALAEMNIKKNILFKSAARPVTYVQGSTGINSYINFPGLSTLPKTTIINKAVLVIKADSTQNSDNFAILPYLTTIELNQDYSVKRDNNRYNYIGLANTGATSGSFGIYNDSTSLYRIDITPYIQSVVQKGSPDYGLGIVPGIPTSGLTTATFFNAAPNRMVLKDFKLELYYSN